MTCFLLFCRQSLENEDEVILESTWTMKEASVRDDPTRITSSFIAD